MKVVHWTMFNGSGLHHVARDISSCEQRLGLDSITVNSHDPKDWERGVGDIHVIHSHIPDKMRTKGMKIVNVQHGTPEHVFQTAVESGLNTSYGASDSLMVSNYWMSHSDVIVTFWERHRDIWKSMCDKHTRVELIPLGVDKSFWKPTESRGKYAGTPSLMTAENCHSIKWPLDLFVMWPWVTEDFPEARLHAIYIPFDQHRWWFPLIVKNGASYRSFVAGGIYDQENLRNMFNSVDYYVGLVRYGDFNRICLEAKACGCKVISYQGNKYADYWITEGDQRVMAWELKSILGGSDPRVTSEVPDIEETAKGMIQIYESL